MKKLKRLLRPLGVGAAVVGVLAGLGFVERNADRSPVTELRVQVDAPEGVHFIDEQAVRAEVLASDEAVIGTPIGNVDVVGIEQHLRAIPSVSSADLYHTPDGVLHVRVEQRRPIARVINADGSSFYIDANGWAMPTSDNYTARVLVFTGDLHELHGRGAVAQVLGGESMMTATRSDEILHLARFITADPLWNALIDQVVVNGTGGFELVPRIGQQRILIGDGSSLERRFAKLREYYASAIPQSGWRKHARVDLRFDDQIVCTLRPTP